MTGMQRRKELVALIEQSGGISLQEIVDRFKVSKMTAHRDLNLLEERGQIKRIFGGAVPPPGGSHHQAAMPSPVPAREQSAVPASSCVVCHRPASQHLLYTITLINGEQRFACCPHCGLSAHLTLRDEVMMAMTSDYLTGRPHPVQRSHFLMGSVAAPCCQPSILTFDDREMAVRFQNGFGGTLGGYADALAFLQEEMAMARKPSCPHCATKATD